VTTYAYDPMQSQLMAVWPLGTGYHAQVVARVDDQGDAAGLAELCEELTQLSRELWDTYVNPSSAAINEQDRAHRQSERDAFANVVAALWSPNLPSETGELLVSYVSVAERGHRVGRVLHQLNTAALTDAVVADVTAEIAAVEQAEQGDLSGRAAQATTLDRVDASPVQVVAAGALFEASPLGGTGLFTTLDPAAACVAAAHWLTAAATVAGDLAEIDPAAVFAESDSISICSVEVPQFVVGAISDADQSPRDVVLHLLREAVQVRDGKIPDLHALLAQIAEVIAEVSERAEQLPEPPDDQTYQALLPERLTPLGPQRPARDLLEHLLDGLRACSTLFNSCIDYDPDTDAPVLDGVPLPHPHGQTWPKHDPDDENPHHINAINQAIDTAFLARVRDEANLSHHRIT
jgi:hypothetical protein